MTATFARVMDLVFPGDTNHHGTLFSGIGLALMDKVAFIAAVRHVRTNFVTASCEHIDFVAPARLGDLVEVTGEVIGVGRRSLAVATELFAEAPLTGERRLCGHGKFNMVAVGEPIGGMLSPPGKAQPPVDAPLMTELIFPDRVSHYGSLYGGHAIAAMAKAAFIAASRHSRQRVVLASCSRADLESQVHNGELLDVLASGIDAGRSSMTVAVELWAESVMSADRRFCGRGEFVMVAVDEAIRPKTIERPDPGH